MLRFTNQRRCRWSPLSTSGSPKPPESGTAYPDHFEAGIPPYHHWYYIHPPFWEGLSSVAMLNFRRNICRVSTTFYRWCRIEPSSTVLSLRNPRKDRVGIGLLQSCPTASHWSLSTCLLGFWVYCPVSNLGLQSAWFTSPPTCVRGDRIIFSDPIHFCTSFPTEHCRSL